MTTLPEIKELLTQIRDDQRRLVSLAEGLLKTQLMLIRRQVQAAELHPGHQQDPPASKFGRNKVKQS